ncbi:chemotaxis protein CheX [Isoptericola sp. NEAU-Y5]|uniref:Chemotaxis protein CheX n=1 Tax=Isoptericola luteus TaxID=2879484 RepID=A0ABS7ZJR0_9MICO|nr:chemotaxis protein CheX [Isoptericola sp. NEAU-Y5]MCA5895153.1 chemotaxis protein CheX [Isoptericola sp. NEAU-Y5]
MTDTTTETMTETLARSVLPIAQDLFSAMIDGEPGLLQAGTGTADLAAGSVRARVDIVGPTSTRAEVVTTRPTADRIARALLQMADDEPLSGEDVEDALGEVANVVGGNLKGMLPEGSSLTLPVVELDEPASAPAADHDELLLWRGEPLVISLWTMNGEEL